MADLSPATAAVPVGRLGADQAGRAVARRQPLRRRGPAWESQAAAGTPRVCVTTRPAAGKPFTQPASTRSTRNRATVASSANRGVPEWPYRHRME